MEYLFPLKICSDYSGYNELIDFNNSTKKLLFDSLILDFKHTQWFDANLLAVLGALLNKLQNNVNTIEIINLNSNLKSLFRRNHFLSNFGDHKIKDYYETTIKYKKFKVNDEKLFKTYLDNELLSKKAMPEMSKMLRKKINESIFEIFNNAVIHGNCQNIFSCGQYFPKLKKLDFTIVDLGKTIRKNVKDYLKKEISGSDSIKWALEVGNTTRTGSIPGGLGLKLITNFLILNKGKLQIVSSNGYYQQISENKNFDSFSSSFPGTIVNLEFKIDNKNYYYLESEVNEEEVF